MKKRILINLIHFFKRETVFCFAFLAAIITMFFVPPNLDYLTYIDFRVLALLFCLMAVIAGFNSLGIFDRMLPVLLRFTHTSKQLTFLLVFLCFFLSMVVTNDVALITLVPFTIMILHRLKCNHMLISVVVMETIAANLGSMCTPIGNPQNLYLYTISNMDILSFLNIMLPLSVMSLILIAITLFFFPNQAFEIDKDCFGTSKPVTKNGRLYFIINLILLGICLGTVLHLVDYRITFAIVTLVLLITQRNTFLHVDYMLLLTFIAFFLFVGNLKNIPAIHSFLVSIVNGHEVTVSIALSQVISNVPGAVLLSAITDKYSDLMIGTNLGGLGTLIASMASLISFKYYCLSQNCKRLRFLGVFTAFNMMFLALLYIAYRLIYFV